LPFSRLFEPAIDYATRGFHVTPIISKRWGEEAAELHGQPGFADCFMPNGRAPTAGELFRSTAIARSLQLIAETNGDSFYSGELAQRIAAFAASHGAALAEEDLAAHRNHWCGTIWQRVSSVDVHEIPPNGQGIAALMALSIAMSAGIELMQPDSTEAVHLQIESIKLALADVEAYVADRDNMVEITAGDLLDPAYLASRVKIIDNQRAQEFKAGAPLHGGTVYLAAADEDGVMVSYIQSNFKGFGSGIVVPGTGISLQNRGLGFTLVKDHPNQVGPSKRPFHTIIPGFVTDHTGAKMAFGVMGGAMQAQGHLQIALRTQVWDQDPQTAADAPRWRFITGRRVAVEADFPRRIAAELKTLGHEIIYETSDTNFSFGGAQLICRIDGGYVAGSDPRKDGQAAGF
jgi:gamma-glutamyltranspeptidase/glutathione hydrolase